MQPFGFIPGGFLEDGLVGNVVWGPFDWEKVAGVLLLSCLAQKVRLMGATKASFLRYLPLQLQRSFGIKSPCKRTEKYHSFLKRANLASNLPSLGYYYAIRHAKPCRIFCFFSKIVMSFAKIMLIAKMKWARSTLLVFIAVIVGYGANLDNSIF